MYAYVLVALDDINVEHIAEELQNIKEVEEAHILFGEWDLIIKLKTSTPEDVARFVLEQVRTREEVRLTSTLIVAK